MSERKNYKSEEDQDQPSLYAKSTEDLEFK